MIRLKSSSLLESVFKPCVIHLPELQLAPPATRLEDFEYHWKLILNYYQNYDDSVKVHIEDTRIPHHLNQMLQVCRSIWEFSWIFHYY